MNDPSKAAEQVRNAMQVALHDRRVRMAESDPELKEHLDEARQMLEAARQNFDNGPQPPEDPIEAEAQRQLQAEKDKAAIEDRIRELKEAEESAGLEIATRDAAEVESTSDAAEAKADALNP